MVKFKGRKEREGFQKITEKKEKNISKKLNNSFVFLPAELILACLLITLPAQLLPLPGRRPRGASQPIAGDMGQRMKLELDYYQIV